MIWNLRPSDENGTIRTQKFHLIQEKGLILRFYSLKGSSLLFLFP